MDDQNASQQTQVQQKDVPDTEKHDAETQQRERDEEARIRAKYPHAPNACALAQRRLAQSQSKKFFDSGDYNMAKATVSGKILKKGVVVGTTETKAKAAQGDEPSKAAEVQPTDAAAATEVVAGAAAAATAAVTEAAPETAKVDDKLKARPAGEGEHEAMGLDEAQRVVEHPPPSILLPPPAARAHSDAGRPREWRATQPLSPAGIVGGNSSDGEAEGERERLHVQVRHRHMTVSGADAAPSDLSPTKADGDGSVNVGGAAVRAAPNAVPMRRISLLQRQNRGMLDVS